MFCAGLLHPKKDAQKEVIKGDVFVAVCGNFGVSAHLHKGEERRASDAEDMGEDEKDAARGRLASVQLEVEEKPGSSFSLGRATLTSIPAKVQE